MDVTIYGLAAFSYTWNKERDNQVSLVTAFARVVMAVSVGKKINADDIRSMCQDHPTSIFARTVSQRPMLSNMLYTDDSAGHQQTAKSSVRERVCNSLNINTSEWSWLKDSSVETTTTTSDTEEPCTDESDAGGLTDNETTIEDKENLRESNPATVTISQPPDKVAPTSIFARPLNQDDFSFLSDFTCAETTEEELTDKKAYLDDWFSTYHDTFVAHASPTVAEAYQSMLVEDQQLLSAEALCRKGFFNFETTAQYDRKNLIYDVEKIKKLIFQENIPLYDIKIEPREDQLYLFQCTFVKDGIALSFQEKCDFFDRIMEIATKK